MSWMVYVDGHEDQLRWIRQVVTALISEQEAVVNLNGFPRVELEMLLAGSMALLAGYVSWAAMGTDASAPELWADFCLVLEQFDIG